MQLREEEEEEEEKEQEEGIWRGSVLNDCSRSSCDSAGAGVLDVDCVGFFRFSFILHSAGSRATLGPNTDWLFFSPILIEQKGLRSEESHKGSPFYS